MSNIIKVRGEYFLQDIKEAGLLPEKLELRVANLLPELEHNFKTQTLWRTETEIRCSVLNDKDFPDKASKFHQAKLEQMVFFEQLLDLSFEYRKTQQKLNIKEAEIEEIEDKLLNDDLKEYQIKKMRARLEIKNIEKQEIIYSLENMRVQGKERVRELEIWSKIKNELNDGSFDTDNKDKNQLISLTIRYIQEAFNISKFASGTDIGSAGNIMAQFHMLVKECLVRGLLNDVLNYFGSDSEITKWLISYFGLEVIKND
ncbi:MAG: hypothetical protein GX896_09160 [Clostridiales bacterium]|nr:hypothetical protein [Clostridiales bacterium]